MLSKGFLFLARARLPSKRASEYIRAVLGSQERSSICSGTSGCAAPGFCSFLNKFGVRNSPPHHGPVGHPMCWKWGPSLAPMGRKSVVVCWDRAFCRIKFIQRVCVRISHKINLNVTCFLKQHTNTKTVAARLW